MDYFHSLFDYEAKERERILQRPRTKLVPIDADTYNVVIDEYFTHDWILRFYDSAEKAERERLLLEKAFGVRNIEEVLAYGRGPLYWNVIIRSSTCATLDQCQLSTSERKELLTILRPTLRELHRRGIRHGAITARNITYERDYLDGRMRLFTTLTLDGATQTGTEEADERDLARALDFFPFSPS